jgi:predicted transcriptional regulator of viral defense system
VEEARAEEIENLWKEIVAEQPQPSEDRVVHISAPRVAVSAPSTVTDFIIQALMELEEAGYEGADRAAVVKIVSRNAPKIKPNTVRVSFSRLLKQGRIERVGKLYRLPQT